MKFILIMWLVLVNSTFLFSCSCSKTSFCGILNKVEEGVVFKGETIGIKSHNNGYHSAIIKVLTKLKGQEVLTDTIEIFGGTNTAGCQSRLNLNEGDINYFAIINASFSAIETDQFEHESENYWVTSASQCLFRKLKIEGEFVTGDISPELVKYPLALFERDLMNCSFVINELQKNLCPDFQVYPNPVRNELFLKNTDNSRLIDELNAYSVTGQLLFSADRDLILSGRIELPNLEEKMAILELRCGDERKLQKIFIAQ